MDIKGVVFVSIVIVLLLFVARIFLGGKPKVVYVPEYIPSNPSKPGRRKWKKDTCKICSGCGKLGAKGYCCAKPRNDFYPPQCLPNLSKHKCNQSNTQFNDFEYTWCDGKKKKKDDKDDGADDDNGADEDDQ